MDIYIPEINLAIEYDGSHWHKDTENDLKKDKILKEHNIDIIRVRDSHKVGDTVEVIVERDGKEVTLTMEIGDSADY